MQYILLQDKIYPIIGSPASRQSREIANSGKFRGSLIFSHGTYKGPTTKPKPKQ